MTRCLLLLAVALTPACAQDKPISMVTNGGFEWAGGWSRATNSTIAPGGRTGRCLEVTNAATISQSVSPQKGVHV